MLAFAQLFFNLAHASPHTPMNASQQKAEKKSASADERRKKRPVKTSEKKTSNKTSKPEKKTRQTPAQTTQTKKKTSVAALSLSKAKNSGEEKKLLVKRYAPQRKRKGAEENDAASVDNGPLKMSKAHRERYQKARETAMNKLMGQLGKPYLWGGNSPRSGFDCSGLVWYAYKDLVKIKIPRTANEMYHLRDAAQIKRESLEKGDLVFFRINNRGAADHVGVYLGNGKFIQSPRTGKDIQISALSEEYWQRHYVGARRVMTPKTIR